MLEIAGELSRWAGQGRPFAVATVVAVTGSAPRQPGAALAVDGEGTAVGSVSGGCVEGAVYELCRQVLDDGEPVLQRFGYGDEDAFAVGLTCGGAIDILITRVAADGVVAKALHAAARGETLALARVAEGPAALLGRTLLVRADGSYEGALGPTPGEGGPGGAGVPDGAGGPGAPGGSGDSGPSGAPEDAGTSGGSGDSGTLGASGDAGTSGSPGGSGAPGGPDSPGAIAGAGSSGGSGTRGGRGAPGGSGPTGAAGAAGGLREPQPPPGLDRTAALSPGLDRTAAPFPGLDRRTDPSPGLHRTAAPFPGLDRTAARAAGAMLDAGRTGTVVIGAEGSRCGGELTLFVESGLPAPRMIVFGAVDFASALARAGKFLGYHVTVCDARPVFATPARLPDADEIVVDWPHRHLAAARTDSRTVLCVLTHDPKFDIPLLALALTRPAAYIGAMGSRRTHQERLGQLRAAGVGERELARLRGPIGLDLGARTPEETALSIVAEIVADRRGGSGAPLTGAQTPIHHDGPRTPAV